MIFVSWQHCAAQSETPPGSGGSHSDRRKQAGLSQEKLSEKAELHPVYISAVERGAKTISMDALMRIAKALGVRMRDLVDEL